MNKTLVTILALFVVSVATVAPSSAYACSPAPGWPPSASENLSQKDAAFVGTVKSIVQDKSANGEYRVTFDVDTSYKGAVDGTVTVRVQSSSAACGYDDGNKAFKAGTVWSIFAMGNDDDGYTTNSLSLNTSYKSVDAANIAMEKLGISAEDDDAPMACTLQYAPVCGKGSDGTIKTYGNSCTLKADKAEQLYEGECKTMSTVPQQDLWLGMSGEAVMWLQNFLITKDLGGAAHALTVVGPTGYFGLLTKAALAEYQSNHAITPAAGYFGIKTRAAITADSSVPPPAPITATFKGEISAVSTSCFADGICSVTVDGKEVILLTGMRIGAPVAVGSLTGVDSIGDLEKEIGTEAEVYAAQTTEGDADYTLYGNTSYYVKVLK